MIFIPNFFSRMVTVTMNNNGSQMIQQMIPNKSQQPQTAYLQVKF